MLRLVNRLCAIVGFIKSPAKIRVMDTGAAQDPSLEVIKLLWMLINKHASDLSEGNYTLGIFAYVLDRHGT